MPSWAASTLPPPLVGGVEPPPPVTSVSVVVVPWASSSPEGRRANTAAPAMSASATPPPTSRGSLLLGLPVGGGQSALAGLGPRSGGSGGEVNDGTPLPPSETAGASLTWTGGVGGACGTAWVGRSAAATGAGAGGAGAGTGTAGGWGAAAGGDCGTASGASAARGAGAGAAGDATDSRASGRPAASAAAMAAPRATAYNGSISAATTWPYRSRSSRATSGMRDEPPTSSNADRSTDRTPAAASAWSSAVKLSSIRGRIIVSNSGRVSDTVECAPGNITGMRASLSVLSSSFASTHDRRSWSSEPATSGSSAASSGNLPDNRSST